MIKTTLVVCIIAAGVAFAAGWYAGWKSTLKIVDDVMTRKEEKHV